MFRKNNITNTFRILHFICAFIVIAASGFAKNTSDTPNDEFKNLQEFLAAEYMADNSVVIFFDYTTAEFQEYVQVNNVTEFLIKIHGRHSVNNDEVELKTEYLDVTGDIESWAMILSQGEMDNNGNPFDFLYALIDINGIACTEGVDIYPEAFTEMPELTCGENTSDDVDQSSPMSSIVPGETYTIKGFPFIALDASQGKLSIPFGNKVVLVEFNNIQVNELKQVVSGSIAAVSDDGSNYQLHSFKKNKKNNLENSTDICIPPPPPPGYDENGINTTTGLDDFGFDENGINSSTMSPFDRNGFDSSGNYMNTGSPYNPDGCNREGLDEDGNDCPLSGGVNPDAEQYLSENGSQISSTITQVLADCESELTTEISEKSAACQVIRTAMTQIVANNDMLTEELIFGENNQYLNSGMSAHFTSPPNSIGDVITRQADVVDLEQKHVDLYQCDLELTALQNQSSGFDGLPSDYEDQINDAILLWTDYEFQLFSNDPEKLENWIKQQLEALAAGEDITSGGNFVRDSEEAEVISKEDLKQKISDIFAYKNNAFGVQQPVIKSAGKKSMSALMSEYSKGAKIIDGVDRVYYTRQIHEAQMLTGDSDMYNIMPLKLTNPMNDKPYDIFIERIEIGLSGAILDAVILIEDTKNGGHIVFRGENLGFGTGGFSDDAASYLRLDSEIGIRLNNASKLHLLPEDTYVSWDCNGFKAIGVAAEIEFCPEFIKPVINGVVSETQNYRLAVQASEVSNWNDFHFQINAAPFVLTNYETVIWQMDAFVADFSTSKTEPNVTLPGYESNFVDGSGMLTNEWEGFYIQNLKATMPKNFSDDVSESDGVFEVAVDLAIIDDGGFTGQGSVTTELVSIEEGSLGGWAFSIDQFFLRVVNNQFAGTGFGGGIQIPIMEDTMSYTAEIYPGDKYKFTVNPIQNSESQLFNANLKIDNSLVVIEKNEQGFHTFADITGSVEFDQTLTGNADFSGVNLPSLTFSNFQISNQAPYFSPGIWEIGSGGIGVGFGGFKIELDNIKPYQPEDENTVGLGFNIALILNDEMDISAEGRLGIVGELQDDGIGRQKWMYRNMELKSLKVDAPIGSVAHISGAIAFEKNDPNWGDYFQGALKVDLKKIAKTEVTGIAQFGTKNDEKYFYVDVLVDLPVGIPVGPIEITALGLGVYRNVTYTTEGLSITQLLNTDTDNIVGMVPNAGLSLSGGVYVYDTGVDFGIKGIAQFQTANEQMLNGTVTLGAEFGGQAIQRLFLSGSAQFLATINNDILAQAGNIENINPTTWADQAGDRPSSVTVPMSAYVSLNMNFETTTFTGDLAAYLNTPLIKGAGTDGAVVLGKIHFSPSEWYIKLGSPTNRAGLVISIDNLIDVSATGYFQVGTNTDPMAEIPQQVRDIAYTASRNESLLRTGQGLIFGAKLEIAGGIGLSGVAEAELTAIAGFDLMLRRFDGLSCAGEPGEIGIKGWYAAGQLYALLEGKIKVFGVKLFEAGVAAILQAQLPNPFFAEATVAVKAKLLFVTINKSLTIALGEQCDLQADEPSAIFGADVIASMTPADGQQEVSVASQPQINMNFPIDRNFSMPSITGGESTFKVKVKDISAVGISSGNLPVSYSLSSDGTIVNVNPVITLPSTEEITFTVTVELFEGSTLLGDQSRSFTFLTGAPLEDIPLSNVKHAYPFHDMEYYYQGQSSNNFIELFSGQPDMFEGDVHLMLTSTTGLAQELPLTYVPVERRIKFTLPDNMQSTEYRLEVIKEEESGRQYIIHTLNFGVSAFDKFRDKVQEIEDNFSGVGKFNSGKLVTEEFSSYEVENLITSSFNISNSKRDQFLEQFDQFGDCITCYQPVDFILNNAEVEEVFVSKNLVTLRYEIAFERIYNGMKNEQEECILENCGDNSDCENILFKEDTKKSIGECGNVPPFQDLPSGNYSIDLSYKIPGLPTANAKIDFTK